MVTPAPLVEWGFQTEVSMPKADKPVLVRLPMEFAFKGKNGGFKATNTGDPSLTKCFVSVTYFLSNAHGQIWGISETAFPLWF